MGTPTGRIGCSPRLLRQEKYKVKDGAGDPLMHILLAVSSGLIFSPTRMEPIERGMMVPSATVLNHRSTIFANLLSSNAAMVALRGVVEQYLVHNSLWPVWEMLKKNKEMREQNLHRRRLSEVPFLSTSLTGELFFPARTKPSVL